MSVLPRPPVASSHRSSLRYLPSTFFKVLVDMSYFMGRSFLSSFVKGPFHSASSMTSRWLWEPTAYPFTSSLPFSIVSRGFLAEVLACAHKVASMVLPTVLFHVS